MKKISVGLFSLCLFATAAVAQTTRQDKQAAQTGKNSPAYRMTIAETAKTRTERMTTLLQLTPEQSRKIETLLLEQGRKDSVLCHKINRLRAEQKTQYTKQEAEIKKILTPHQAAVMNALPAMRNGAGEKKRSCAPSQCCPASKMKQRDDYRPLKAHAETRQNQTPMQKSR